MFTWHLQEKGPCFCRISLSRAGAEDNDQENCLALPRKKNEMTGRVPGQAVGGMLNKLAGWGRSG